MLARTTFSSNAKTMPSKRMLRWILAATLATLPLHLSVGQSVESAEAIIAKMRAKTEQAIGFSANVSLALDVDFIRMPEKFARMEYKAPDSFDFDSEDFIVIPKRGLDFSFAQVFETDYSALLQGIESVNGHDCHVVKVIPKGRSRLAIATLLIDAQSYQTRRAELVSKNHGAYVMAMDYDQKELSLPTILEISFEMEKFNLPLRYLGKNATIDKDKMKAQETKTGKITLSFTDYLIDLATP